MYKRVNELLGTKYKSDSEISWRNISSKKLSEFFIREFQDKVNWENISRHQTLSESFIREFEDKVEWYDISRHQTLSESFIREFKDRVNWSYISNNQVLSKSFIREFKDKVDWVSISICQILSENFIREFEDWVDWGGISTNQLLSWNFMLEFKDRISWDNISLYQPFIDPEYEKIDKGILSCNKLHYLYQETKEKGWFVGYVEKGKGRFSVEIFTSLNFTKSRIYWKDLIKINKVKYFEPVRQMKYV